MKNRTLLDEPAFDEIKRHADLGFDICSFFDLVEFDLDAAAAEAHAIGYLVRGVFIYQKLHDLDFFQREIRQDIGHFFPV